MRLSLIVVFALLCVSEGLVRTLQAAEKKKVCPPKLSKTVMLQRSVKARSLQKAGLRREIWSDAWLRGLQEDVGVGNVGPGGWLAACHLRR